ncbi:Vms1/Ankzf1 family peptidyl-tRNA hydrolase [Halorientalis brevis]|uniref:Vms1/Ankzf1 family peptidyl-tRNA hydrolase n=1 Tax=Halorientalis brevis TaxID=1126241 RepID=A0ABD6C7Q5_9EURY|nr:Vms1/Ankzf1 family peptidyl-tRNA hydrolase [Halorientalis brevis]
MLDQLLGRAELKARIADLEDEKEHLERQLDAEQERRADAASARQEAEKRVNRLEDRIAELEGTVDRLEGDDGGHLDFRRTERLRGERLTEVLDRLDSVETEREGALTAYVDADVPDRVRDALGERAALVSRAAPCLVCVDDAGLVSTALSVPAPPAPFAEWSAGFSFERSWLEPTGEFTLALVRSDLFAMGEYDGRERTAFHGFDSELKSQHSKGGFSQARFERLRNEQIDTHVDRCLEALDERETERLYVVGERTVLGEFSDVADATATVDATGDPEDALADAFHDFWTVKLRGL